MPSSSLFHSYSYNSSPILTSNVTALEGLFLPVTFLQWNSFCLTTHYASLLYVFFFFYFYLSIKWAALRLLAGWFVRHALK